MKPPPSNGRGECIERESEFGDRPAGSRDEEAAKLLTEFDLVSARARMESSILGGCRAKLAACCRSDGV